MAQFAVINGTRVLNIIVADSQEIAEEVTGLLCVETYEGAVGDEYDEETNQFIKPFIDVAADGPLAPEEPVIAPVVPIEETPAE